MPLASRQEGGRCGQYPKRGEDPMKTSAYTRILVVILAALALAACPGKKGKHNDDPEIYYVSAVGSDNNPGTQRSPFKTITHALRGATRSGSTTRGAPRTHNAPHGEKIRHP